MSCCKVFLFILLIVFVLGERNNLTVHRKSHDVSEDNTTTKVAVDGDLGTTDKTYDLPSGIHFSCQHGTAECFGNKLHACALNVVHNSTKAVLFNACLMEYNGYRRVSHRDYVAALNWCGHKQRVLVNEIWECVNNTVGAVLLKQHGEATHAVSPPYVPYVVLNGDTTHQDQATENLLLVVCNLLTPTPVECVQ